VSDRKQVLSNTKSSRDERLKAALRENLKRRKAQARGRSGMTIVTPEDDKRAEDGMREDR
jgi:hypothetical protein